MDSLSEIVKIPARIHKHLSEYANKSILDPSERTNLEITIDLHWFFLHSKYHKENYNNKKHIGKWKYNATSTEDLFEKIKIILPLVASRQLAVSKFTNLANVFNNEKLIVVYCFSFGLSAKCIGDLLNDRIGDGVYWGSVRFKKP